MPSNVRSLSGSRAANATTADAGRVQDAEQVLAGAVTATIWFSRRRIHAVRQARLRGRRQRWDVRELLARDLQPVRDRFRHHLRVRQRRASPAGLTAASTVSAAVSNVPDSWV